MRGDAVLAGREREGLRVVSCACQFRLLASGAFSSPPDSGPPLLHPFTPKNRSPRENDKTRKGETHQSYASRLPHSTPPPPTSQQHGMPPAL